MTTPNSAMNSRVLESPNAGVKLVFVEPAEGKKKSQVEEYIDYHQGAGVQHIAFSTKHICETVDLARNKGVEFLVIPEEYYNIQSTKVEYEKYRFQELKKRSVLIDKDDNGYLVQIFTKWITSRVTFFIELIQRESSHGFGQGNIKALFQAVEAEQDQCEGQKT